MASSTPAPVAMVLKPTAPEEEVTLPTQRLPVDSVRNTPAGAVAVTKPVPAAGNKAWSPANDPLTGKSL